MLYSFLIKWSFDAVLFRIHILQCTDLLSLFFPTNSPLCYENALKIEKLERVLGIDALKISESPDNDDTSVENDDEDGDVAKSRKFLNSSKLTLKQIKKNNL